MFFYSEQDGNLTPIDPYFNNVSLLLKMDSNFSDSSLNNHTINVVGDTAIVDGSAQFDGNGDYLSLVSPSLTIAANEAYTIEFWLKFNSRDSRGASVFDLGTHDSADDLTFLCQTNISAWKIHPPDGNYSSAWSSMIDGNWRHVAHTRDSSGNWFGFVDGVQVVNGSGYTQVVASNGSLRISGLANYAGYGFAGSLKDFRITKGVARYTSNFTPPDSLPTS